MATWTNKAKPATSAQFDLLIETGFKLVIETGYNFIIQGASSGTDYTNKPKP